MISFRHPAKLMNQCCRGVQELTRLLTVYDMLSVSLGFQTRSWVRKSFALVTGKVRKRASSPSAERQLFDVSVSAWNPVLSIMIHSSTRRLSVLRPACPSQEGETSRRRARDPPSASSS